MFYLSDLTLAILVTKVITRYFTSFVYFICSYIFLVQIYLITSCFLWPDKFYTVLTKEELQASTFPALVRVCVSPRIDKEQLAITGYNHQGYIAGMSRFNSSVLGWTGHKKKGRTNLTAEGKTSGCVCFIHGD